METITIVIPIFNLNGERKRNFERIIEGISITNISTIVIEQKSQASVQNDVIRIQTERSKTNISFLSVDITQKTIHKSRLINEASQYIATKYMWMLDADVFFDHNKIIELINDQDVIKPFQSIIRLTQEETEYFLANRKLNFKKGEIKPQTKIFGPMSFIIKTDIFKKEKMNESFNGYGWEDIEFAERIQDKYKITEFNTIRGIHLYHPHDRTNSEENKEKFIKLRGYNPEADNSIPQYIKEKSVYVETFIKEDQENLIDLSNLSIIIPIKIDTDDRLYNITKCLEYLYSYFKNFELIIIEQDEQPKLEDLSKKYNCIYVNRKIEGTFHKTYNLNLGISMSKNEFCASYDCDVVFKPSAIKAALQRLISQETHFIYPYNGYMLEIKKSLMKTLPDHYVFDFPTIQSHLEVIQDGMRLLYGTEKYECTGGCFMFNKKQLFLSGAYNTNIISYGCEDNELETRLKMLDMKVERLLNYNCYHMEHGRSTDSTYNNYYKSNIEEFCRIKSMTIPQLRTYVDSGYKHIQFDVSKNLKIQSSPDSFSIKVIQPHKQQPRNASIKCSILYTTYGNETQTTEEYIQRFLSWKTKEYELIAVVHDETPLHRAYLQYCQNIGIIDKLIFCESNHGHLKGVMIGSQYVSSDILMVINNDVRISKDIIDRCIARFNEKKNLGVIGWHYDFTEDFEGTFWIDGKLHYERRLDKPATLDEQDVKNILKSPWFTGKVFKEIETTRILCCNGSFLCTRTDLWNKIGGMNPNLYTHDFADDYYCYGVLDLGYDIENIPKDVRMGKNKDIFECKSDNHWHGIKDKGQHVDELTYPLYGCLTKEQSLMKLLSYSYNNPNILLIGDEIPEFINDIPYKRVALQDEIIDIFVINGFVSDINIAKRFLSKNGCIVSIHKFNDEAFVKCGSLFVYFNNKTRESYE